MLRQESQKLRFVGAAMLLLTQYKTAWLTVISGHCLAAKPVKDVCVQRTHLQQNAYCGNLKK